MELKSTQTETVSLRNDKPGSLPPLGGAAIPEGQLIQLGEEVVRDVLEVVVLRAQDELDALGRRVCATGRPERFTRAAGQSTAESEQRI